MVYNKILIEATAVSSFAIYVATCSLTLLVSFSLAVTKKLGPGLTLGIQSLYQLICKKQISNNCAVKWVDLEVIMIVEVEAHASIQPYCFAITVANNSIFVCCGIKFLRSVLMVRYAH